MADVPGSGMPFTDRLTDASPTPTFLLQDGVVRYVNDAFVRLYGGPATAIVDRSFIELVSGHDRSHLAEHLNTLRAPGDGHRLQIRLRRPDDEEVWVSLAVVYVEIEGRGAALGTAMDVRERRHAQEAVARAQRLDAVARLAGGIAHQFNNALQVIVGHAERILAAVPDTSDPVHGSAAEIKVSAGRAAALTDRLLTFGQRQLLDPTAVDVPGFIADVRAGLAARLRPTVALDVQQATWNAPARVDRERFLDALTALVDHAQAAMPAGGLITIATARVTVDAEARRERPWLRDGAYVQLSVEDSGPGLDAETAAHVFEPFYQGTSGPGADDGLGLAPVYGLVKQSHGFVWVEPGARGGTRVVALLPLDGGAPAHDAVPTEAAPRAAPVERPRVVVVEDEEAVRELLTHALERNGFQVYALGSAEEAAELVPATYDVLLTDISLPGMTGVELARRVRHAAPKTRILLMSGYAREEYLTTSDDLPFIGKPFTSRAIVERLRALLSESELTARSGPSV